MTSATFPGSRAGLPSSAEEVAAMAAKLLGKRPKMRGPECTKRGTVAVKVPGRRKWGQELARLIEALCDLPAGRQGLERIFDNSPEILAMVNARRAEAHNTKGDKQEGRRNCKRPRGRRP